MHFFGLLSVMYTIIFGLRSSSLALCDDAWGDGCMEDIPSACAGEGEVKPWMALLYIIGLSGLLATQTAATGMCYHLYADTWPSGVKVTDEVRLQPAPKEEEKPVVTVKPREEPIQVITLRDPNINRLMNPVNPKPAEVEPVRSAKPTTYITTRQEPSGKVINPNGKRQVDRTVVARWGF